MEILQSTPRRWEKMFPDEFYDQVWRLKGWGTRSKRRRNYFPPDLKGLGVVLVYSRMGPGIMKALERKMDSYPGPMKNVKRHQFLTLENGVPLLRAHIDHVIEIMQSSSTWEDFMIRLDSVLPVNGPL